MSGRPPSLSRPSSRVLEGEVREMGRGLRVGDAVPRRLALCPWDPYGLAGLCGRCFHVWSGLISRESGPSLSRPMVCKSKERGLVCRGQGCRAVGRSWQA